MNIFYLHHNTHKCAIDHLDKHIVKMPTEYGQLLSTAHRMLDGTMYLDKTANNRNIKRWRHPDEEMEAVLYKASHCGHPSAVWCRETNENYEWLYDMWCCLHEEFKIRYDKDHKSYIKLRNILKDVPENIPDVPFTQPLQAMPDDVKHEDSITAYRNYYIKYKKSFATWKTKTPKWYTQGA